MNIRSLTSLIAITIVTVLPSLAEESIHGESTPVGVKVTMRPQFPFSLSNSGLTEGRASFLVVVDQQGTRRDHLLIECSHLEFAKEVEAVLPEWEFTAAIIEGQRVNAVTRIDVNFRQTGTLISLSGGQTLTGMFIDQLVTNAANNAYRVSDLSELDRLPEPIQIVEPSVPSSPDMNPAGLRVVYHFFIDQTGRVRIPHLREREVMHIGEPVLDALYDALMQWEFTPPTIDGVPVVSRASQPFWIRPAGQEELAEHQD